MQIKLFTIPIMGGEKLIDELNVFLRSRKILQIESQLVNEGQSAFWCFCVRYIDSQALGSKPKGRKVDYKEVLGAASYQRFSRFKEIRKKIAQEEAIPAYAVFTDKELAALANLATLTLAKMYDIKGN